MTAAANFGLMFRGRYYYILAGYDDGELARFGPGAVQLQDVMRYAAEHGCKLFDFTIGDEPYKREWCDIEIGLCDYVAPASLRGSAGGGADGGFPSDQALHQAQSDGLGVRPQGAVDDGIAARLDRRSRPPDQHVQAEPALGDQKQQRQFDDAGRRDHDGNAHASVRAGHREASGQVQREHGGIDQRAAALLAQHVEQRAPPARPRRARRARSQG